VAPSSTSRDRYLRRTYGITEAQYGDLFDAGDGGCWICGRPPKNRALHVDHDHKTGRVRGLLCWRCNRGLQQYSDRPAILRDAASYLESGRAQEIIGETDG
jgi:hypothetical protein